MKVLVIYDSTYGNTEHIAQAVARGLSEHESVTLLPVANVGDIAWDDIDLLIVGGPTHGHGMSEPLKAWLGSLPPNALHGVVAVTFDTRFHIPKFLSGSAAESVEHRLKKLGAEVLLPPESFYVTKSEGPLADGELERAERWASLTPAGVLEAPA